MPRALHPFTLLTLCLAVLAAQIDTAVVNLATRPIGVQFDAGVDALQWVLDSYNLVYAVLLLSGGLLADLYGRRRKADALTPRRQASRCYPWRCCSC